MLSLITLFNLGIGWKGGYNIDQLFLKINKFKPSMFLYHFFLLLKVDSSYFLPCPALSASASTIQQQETGF